MLLRCGQCQMGMTVVDGYAGPVNCPHCGAGNMVHPPQPQQQYGVGPSLPPAQGSPSPLLQYAMTPGQGNVGYYGQHNTSQEGLAIMGLALAFLFPPAGILLSGAALVGMRAHRNNEGKKLAMAGIIIGSVVTFGFIAWAIAGPSFLL